MQQVHFPEQNKEVEHLNNIMYISHVWTFNLKGICTVDVLSFCELLYQS